MKISNPGFCIGIVILSSTWPINALYMEDTYPKVTFVSVSDQSFVSFSVRGGGGVCCKSKLLSLKGLGHEIE
jgi:hypothetical protein